MAAFPTPRPNRTTAPEYVSHLAASAERRLALVIGNSKQPLRGFPAWLSGSTLADADISYHPAGPEMPVPRPATQLFL